MKVWAIFIDTGTFITDVPWVDNDDGGLPEWYFELQNTVAILIDGNNAEWVPAIGPAPFWKSDIAGSLSRDAMFKMFNEWMKDTY